MEHKFRYRQAKRATLIGGVCNFFLSLFKIIVGLVGHSQALFADGLHSLSDLLTDALVLFASRAGSQAPDAKHPYGHGRIETLSTVIVSIMLIVVAVGIIIDAIYNSFLHPSFVKPDFWTLVIALLSILVNEILFRYTLNVGKRIRSNILNANAWHHRTDSFSSLIVLVGIAGSMLGIHYFDGVAAIIVALFILKMGIKMSWNSIQELTDASVDGQLVQQFQKAVKNMSGIKSVHQLRTRLIGGAIFIDMHVQVDSRISVSEGHYLGEQAQKLLISQFPEVADVTVHVDSEDDALVMQSILLPERDVIETELRNAWKNCRGANQIRTINLHYLAGKIEADVYLPVSVLENLGDGKKLQAKYQQCTTKVRHVKQINLFFS